VGDSFLLLEKNAEIKLIPREKSCPTGSGGSNTGKGNAYPASPVNTA